MNKTLAAIRHHISRSLPRSVQEHLELRDATRDEPEILLIQDLLRRGETLLDVGANNGLYTLASRRVGANVVAVEPQNELAERLRKRWKTPHVTIVEAALSSGEGEATLHQPLRGDGRVLHTRSSLAAGANPGYENRETRVRTTTMDTLCAELPDLAVVKIDVEGFENEVLRSGLGVLTRLKPAVLVEVERRHHSANPWEAFEILGELGYQGWFLAADRTLHPLTEFDPEIHQPVGAVKDPQSTARPAGLVNNFLFLHPDRRGNQRDRLSSRWRITR